MSPSLMIVIAWSYGIAGVLYLVLALRLAIARERTPRSTAMLWATGWTAAWGLAGSAFALTRLAPVLTLSTFADLMAYGGWFCFLLYVVGDGSDRIRRARGWLLPVGIVIVALGVLAHVVILIGVRSFGDGPRLVLLDTLACAVFGLVLVEQVFRNVADESRWTVRPLCLGLAAIFAFDIYTFADGLLFNLIDSDVWTARGLVRAIAWPLLVLALIRTRGGKISIVLSREVMFRSTALAMSGLYLLFMAAAGYYVRYFGGEWGRALQIALLAAAVLLLLVLIFSGSMQAKLRVGISKHFFRYRFDYREEWLRFTQALSTHGQPGAMGIQVVKGLADMVESPAGALWLRDTAGRAFAPAAHWMLRCDDSEDATGPLATFLARRGWVVNLEEYRSFRERYGDLRLPQWLSQLEDAWLVIPLLIGTELTGFVVLTTARTPIDVNWEVNDLLKTAARQGATFLGHTLATEALLEARKFEAFNRLSAFVVHDLKNIVAQLSLMLRNAERHHGNPEFQRDMLMTVEHAVERMKQLMLQLRDGTTPLDATHGIDLVDIGQRVQRAKAGQQPSPTLDVQSAVHTRGHADRLERVIGHLVQNAIDATPADGRVWIRIGQQESHAVVEVGDTGHGMTQEFIKERLFKPFQTTKQTGMGIGAYESSQYVQELGGRVLVESTPDVGTRVRLLLPLFEAAAPQIRERDLA